MSSILTPAIVICVDCGKEEKAKGSARCRSCKNSRKREEYKNKGSRYISLRKRQSFIDEIKNLPCQDCNQRFPPECMDFDHRDPDLKLFEIGKSNSGQSKESRMRLMLEVSKCDLICSNCHRIRTKNRTRPSI